MGERMNLRNTNLECQSSDHVTEPTIGEVRNNEKKRNVQALACLYTRI
jgi:hypothetical protein